MNPQRYDSQQPQRPAENKTEENRQPRQDADARARAEIAARAVMHPDSYDQDWRYYHGALGG